MAMNNRMMMAIRNNIKNKNNKNRLITMKMKNNNTMKATPRLFSTHSMTQYKDSDEVQQIRQSVRSICADFPGEYWRDLDKEEEYPTEFVKAMTDSGFLGILIPEAYGGSGLGFEIDFCSTCGTKVASRPQVVDGLTYIPAGFLKNEIDFSPQVEIFAYNKYKCFGNPETLVESFDDNGTVERISAVIEAMNQS